MKTFGMTILVGVLVYFLHPFLPWYSPMIFSIIVFAAIEMKLGNVFAAAFFGSVLASLILTFQIDTANEAILSSRMAGIFDLTSSIYLHVITALIAGISGMLGGFLGYSFRRMLVKRRKDNLYYGGR
ncbi:hypothetical protein OO013_14960 [Mangrovivirga sp. M17]|uniref:DUF1097 domain-containing protein n=1 Tax=Mangrovivirga halotolerans TaxID=2993936 RepID=A0ABT3RTR4_9BACT|nr:hypothetical protein [Mangrovivirga halotolerans]MCX2745178.1 hypothetical protein [Mangrovivirga halotolerans]